MNHCPATHHILIPCPHPRELFGCEVGLSHRTMGVGVSVASVALDAAVIEKHFTLNRADGGVNSTFSMESAEIMQLVMEAERAWQALGRISYSPTEAEKKSIQFRRSLYVVQDLKAGDVLTKENVRAIRPGLGLPTKYIGQVLGKDRRAGDSVRVGHAMIFIPEQNHIQKCSYC